MDNYNTTIYPPPNLVINSGVEPPREHDYGATARVVVDVTIGRDAAVAVATVSLDGERYSLSAASKKAPGDKFDRQVAYDYAVARVLEKVVNKLYRRADGAVKHAEDMRLYKRKQRADAQSPDTSA